MSTRPVSFGAAAAVSILVTVSALALWVVGFAGVGSTLQERGSQRQLAAELRRTLADATVPIGGAVERGTAIARLQIPSVDLHDVVVVEGTGAAELQTGPGHRRDTAWPGQPGGAVLMGRSELFGAPFARIADLRTGEAVTVETGDGSFTYKVDRVRRAGEPLPPALAPGAARLTLVTSERVDERASRESVFVDATLQGPARPAEPGRPTSVPGAEAAMAGDSGALFMLVLWLEALVAAVVLMAWTLARWGRRQVLLLGLPVLLAVLWGTTDVATQLLPNLL